MPDHIYTPGDLVERVGTGERSHFVRLVNGGTEVETNHWYATASDCRPVSDHNMKKCPNCENCITNLRKDNAAKDARIVELEGIIKQSMRDLGMTQTAVQRSGILCGEKDLPFWISNLNSALSRLEREKSELEAQLSHIEEYGTQEINAAIGLRQCIAELNVELAASVEQESKLRKLCGEAAVACTNLPEHDACTRETRKCESCFECKNIGWCGYGTVARKLRAAAEGGE